MDSPACAAPPRDTAAQIAHYVAFAPVYAGGLVVELRGRALALDAAIDALGLTDVRTVACPDQHLVAWFPGLGRDGVKGLTSVLVGRGLTVSGSLEFSAGEGRSWLRGECADPVRCEQLLSTAHTEGLCGYTLAALRVSPTVTALAACRALAAPVVMCAAGARDGEQDCEKTVRDAVRAPGSGTP